MPGIFGSGGQPWVWPLSRPEIEGHGDPGKVGTGPAAQHVPEGLGRASCPPAGGSVSPRGRGPAGERDRRREGPCRAPAVAGRLRRSIRCLRVALREPLATARPPGRVMFIIAPEVGVTCSGSAGRARVGPESQATPPALQVCLEAQPPSESCVGTRVVPGCPRTHGSTQEERLVLCAQVAEFPMPLGGPEAGCTAGPGLHTLGGLGQAAVRDGLTVPTPRPRGRGESRSPVSAPSAWHHGLESFPHPPGGRAPSPGSPLTRAPRGLCPPCQPQPEGGP